MWNVNLIRKPIDEEYKEARSIRDARKPSESPRRSQSSHQDYSDLKIILKKDVPIEVSERTSDFG